MIRVEQKLVLAAPPEAVWNVLTDPHQVAACLPGARITEQRADGSYAGTLSLKVGPLTMTYRGVLRFERLDPSTLTAEMLGQGQDVKGKGAAELRMRSQLRRLEGGGTEVLVTGELAVRGVLAQLGRGMVESVAGYMFEEFAATLNHRLAAGPGAATPASVTPLRASTLASAVVTGVFRRG